MFGRTFDPGYILLFELFEYYDAARYIEPFLPPNWQCQSVHVISGCGFPHSGSTDPIGMSLKEPPPGDKCIIVQQGDPQFSKTTVDPFRTTLCELARLSAIDDD